MKLGKVTKNDPMERLPLSVHSSVAKQLQSYRSFYKSETGEEISMSLLVEEMTKKFMSEDKAFQKYLKVSKDGA
jgi:hypothetical protein